MSTLKVTNIQDTSGENSLTTAQIYNGTAKAWVNFNGTGTINTNQSIRASYNVSSVFKNGTGLYTINFSTPFIDSNYVPVSMPQRNAADTVVRFIVYNDGTTKTTSSLQINGEESGGTNTDRESVFVAIFR